MGILLFVLGIVFVSVLIGLSFFIGQKCLHKKCKKMAKRGHMFCERCEKEAGIFK